MHGVTDFPNTTTDNKLLISIITYLLADLGRDGTPSQQVLWKAAMLAKYVCVSFSILSGDYAFHSMFDRVVPCPVFCSKFFSKISSIIKKLPVSIENVLLCFVLWKILYFRIMFTIDPGVCF